jgi:hypothetical protein
VFQQKLGHPAVRKLAYCVVGKSGGDGSILSRHCDTVPNRLKDFFEFLVGPFISDARCFSEVLLPTEIDSAIEGLQGPVERSIVFLADLSEKVLIYLCRLSVAKHSAKAEHNRRTINLHHLISTEW